MNRGIAGRPTGEIVMNETTQGSERDQDHCPGPVLQFHLSRHPARQASGVAVGDRMPAGSNGGRARGSGAGSAAVQRKQGRFRRHSSNRDRRSQ
ncbi:hypothetical protein CCS01_03605 [Rhodopila globiformis]|uniref:Uncharacterized protein n=1 Tax=Rhodopila globiformis TaxID=1071 RepID=A0A2S6NMI9_RHOGL|nr:hypothetical protein CCS01_03605 [Rhodopila globiformis]